MCLTLSVISSVYEQSIIIFPEGWKSFAPVFEDFVVKISSKSYLVFLESFWKLSSLLFVLAYSSLFSDVEHELKDIAHEYQTDPLTRDSFLKCSDKVLFYRMEDSNTNQVEDKKPDHINIRVIGNVNHQIILYLIF